MGKLVYDKKGFGIFEKGSISSLSLEEKGDVCGRYNAFEPGGAVERFLIEWNQWDVGEDIPNRLSEAVADLIALLPKKEGE